MRKHTWHLSLFLRLTEKADRVSLHPENSNYRYVKKHNVFPLHIFEYK